MTSVNETNTITEYKKRLVENIEKKSKDCGNYKDSASGLCRVCDFTKEMRLGYNQALDDILDLINSTN